MRLQKGTLEEARGRKKRDGRGGGLIESFTCFLEDRLASLFNPFTSSSIIATRASRSSFSLSSEAMRCSRSCLVNNASVRAFRMPARFSSIFESFCSSSSALCSCSLHSCCFRSRRFAQAVCCCLSLSTCSARSLPWELNTVIRSAAY